MKKAILKYLPTAEQVADILIKPLEANIFSYLRNKHGLCYALHGESCKDTCRDRWHCCRTSYRNRGSRSEAARERCGAFCTLHPWPGFFGDQRP
jgi:hypothetical protein